VRIPALAPPDHLEADVRVSFALGARPREAPMSTHGSRLPIAEATLVFIRRAPSSPTAAILQDKAS
jgi:hypothetical protein